MKKLIVLVAAIVVTLATFDFAFAQHTTYIPLAYGGEPPVAVGDGPIVPTIPSAASPNLEGPWTWVFGKIMYYDYNGSVPSWSVEFNMSGFYVQCQNPAFRFDDNHYSNIIITGITHWRNYSPYGTLSGSKHLRLSPSWLAGKFVEQQEDAWNPGRYIAQCRTY